MYETGDIVRFREWDNVPWEEGSWIIIETSLDWEFYDSTYYLYIIQNQQTGEVKTEICWIQIECI